MVWLRKALKRLLKIVGVKKQKQRGWPELWREKNVLEMPDSAEVIGQLLVRSGKNNTLRLGEGALFRGKIIVSGRNNCIVLGKNVNFRGQIIVAGHDQTITIGDFSTAGGVYILCTEGQDVTIGRACMFSREIQIRTSDAHAVIDRQTGARTNAAGSIVIGDHVWCGLRAIINKGCHIPDDSIIGANSFVSGKFDESGIVIAGTPAKIVKRGATWHRSKRQKFSPEELDSWRTDAV